MQWVVRTTAFDDATFDRCLAAFDGFEPYVRPDRLNLLRVLAGRHDLRARVGSKAPTLDRLRRATETATHGFSVSFWFQPRGSSPWHNHPDITQVWMSIWPGQHRPAHVAQRLDEGWRRTHGLEAAVTAVDGPGGRHVIWRLSDTPQNLDPAQVARWSAALGDSMPPRSFPGWPSP